MQPKPQAPSPKPRAAALALPALNLQCPQSLCTLLLAVTNACGEGPGYIHVPQLLVHGWRVQVVRMLIARRLVLHLQVLPHTGDGPPRVQPAETDSLTGNSTIALTDRGSQVAREHLCNQAAAERFQWPEIELLLRPLSHAIPFYDAELRRLWLGPEIVKEFLRPAPNQELLLTAFQEQGWPNIIDDPLPPTKGIDSKSRFVEAVKQLNRNQRSPLLFFHRCAAATKVMFVYRTNEKA